jgi:hypothetical protein
MLDCNTANFSNFSANSSPFTTTVVLSFFLAVAVFAGVFLNIAIFSSF